MLPLISWSGGRRRRAAEIVPLIVSRDVGGGGANLTAGGVRYGACFKCDW